MDQRLAVAVGADHHSAAIEAAVARLRTAPPSTLGGLEVSDFVDLEAGWRGLPPTEGVVLALGPWGRVVVRPSGTEPKVKAYVEITPPREGTLAEQRAVAARLVEAVRAGLASLLKL